MLLKDFVNKKIASADKEASAEGVPLTLNNCKKYKKMRDLKVYGNCLQDGTPTVDNPIEVQTVGELVTDETDSNYGKYKIPVVQRGKNLLTAYELYSSCPRYSALTEDGRSCVRFEDSMWTNVSPISFKEKTSYTVSMYAKCVQKNSDNTTGSNVFAFFYEDGTQLVKAMLQNSDWTLYTLTSDPAKTVVGIGIITYNWVNWVYVDADTFQLEESSAVTAYEPYFEPITTNIFLDEPLRKLSGYADCIDFKNNKVVRNIKEITFTGQEEGLTTTNTGNIFALVNAGMIFGSPTMANRFETRRGISDWSNVPDYLVYTLPSNQILYIKNVDIENTLDAFKSYLGDLYAQGTPLTCLFVSCNAGDEPLNIDLPKLTAKTTIIEVDTSLAPNNISGKYILR